MGLPICQFVNLKFIAVVVETESLSNFSLNIIQQLNAISLYLRSAFRASIANLLKIAHPIKAIFIKRSLAIWAVGITSAYSVKKNINTWLSCLIQNFFMIGYFY